MSRVEHGVIRTEAEEQEAVIRWAFYESAYRPELRMLFHIPNGGTRNKREAVHLKGLGVQAGVPDLFLPIPMDGFHGLFIEMKRNAKTARISKEQRAWIEALEKRGYRAVVCYGFEHARDTIINYLEGRHPRDY